MSIVESPHAARSLARELDPDQPAPAIVVVVDDEPLVLRGLERALTPAFEVICYEAASDAIARVRQGDVSVVVSDIAMPGMSGIELLAAVRQHDADLPVVLMTGAPTLESATQAIERGVFRYLPKPIEGKAVTSIVAHACQLRTLAKLKREAQSLGEGLGVDSQRTPADFWKALDALWVAYQPIVSVSGRCVFGYEALLRSSDAAFPSPSHLLNAAERLQAVHRLGRLVRRLAVDGLRADEHALLFVNLHPQDLTDPDLFAPDSPLCQIASRVVLEITERASLTAIDDLQARIAKLRELGFRIAIDDLGAGYAGLTSFALLEPDIVKLDMTLTRDIHASDVKQKLVGSFCRLCREMGVTMVAEGVETAAERAALVALGCDLLQGHLFARPERDFSKLTW